MNRFIIPFALGAALAILLLVPDGRELLISWAQSVWGFLGDAYTTFKES